MLPNVKISNQFANIAKGTTDTGYWIFNLNFLFNWIWILLSCRGNSSYGLNSLWVRWYFQKWPYQYWYCHFWNVLIYWLLICLIDILNTLILTRRSIPNPLRCYIHLRWRFLLSSFEGFLFTECFCRLGQPASGIARGRLRSVQLEVMDEISRDSLAGSNFTKGEGGDSLPSKFSK